MSSHRLGTAIVWALSALGCNRTEVAPTSAPPPTSSPAATAAAPGTAQEGAAAAPAPAPMTKQGKLETVSFSTEPYCRKAAEVGASAEAVAAARPNHPWLSPPALQAKLRVLEEELKPYEPSLIGVTFENEPQTAIVVLYPDFTAYEELQAKLAPRVKPLPVALRPGCHTSQQLAEALT
ncbi:MAG: hypothetical protein K0R38_3613, partial [Polyangiaceae bacterium]|nr:hypothetical protein [Polyangiaceae bacterium]